MGSKKKFWYIDPDKRFWLFKFPRPGTGEHWAEKIVAETAKLLDISHARVELARFQNKRGSTTESFTYRRPRALYHGNQLLASTVSDYNPDKVFGNSHHTFGNIWRTLERFCCEMAFRAKGRFGEYMVLDALVGNTDRHHENWGLLRRPDVKRWNWIVAPSYDHASSLGRELSDTRRDTLHAHNCVGSYSEKAHGAIYWPDIDRRAPSPLELVRQACRRNSRPFEQVLKKLERLDDAALRDIVNRIPNSWMTPSERTFAMTLMHYNLSQLRKL